MLTTEIKNKIQHLWDRLWGGGLSNPITAIENISYLLFMKRLEKFHPEVENKFKWSNYSSLKGTELKKRINEVFAYIQNNLAEENEPFALEMKKAKFEINTPSLLEDVIHIVEDIFTIVVKEESQKQHFQDIQGDVYEYLLKATSEAGKNGQFRTPRHIIQMMVELLQPKINEFDTKICDITSGSSGFLVGCYQYILKENSTHKELDVDNRLEKGLDGDLLNDEVKKTLKEKMFFGFDIDPTMVRIGMMNMMMHSLNKPQISQINSLSMEYENFIQQHYTDQNNNDKNKDVNINIESKHNLMRSKYEKEHIFGKDEFSYILANPPFAAKVNSNSISKNLNRIYNITENTKKAQSLQTELLFLERIIFMLKKEGKAIVIVPEGVLFNSGKAYKRTREILLRDCDLEAVISLPSGIFNPYTAVKTSILLFTKKEFNSLKFHTSKVWFYEMDSDGYTLDNSRKKIIGDYPLPETVTQFKIKNEKQNPQKDRKQKHFYVSIKEIEDNQLELNYNLYKEYVFEEIKHQEPKELLNKLILIEEEIYNSLKKFEKEV